MVRMTAIAMTKRPVQHGNVYKKAIMRKWISVSGVAFLLTLTGCFSISPREHRARALPEYLNFVDPPVKHFPYFRLAKWEMLRRDKLVVWTSARDAYLLTVDDTCPALEWTQIILLTSSANHISKNFDAVITRDQKCRIREIEPIRYSALLATRHPKTD